MRLHHLTTAITFCAAMLVGVVLATAQPSNEPIIGKAPRIFHGSSEYLPSGSALRAELRLEADGYLCTEVAALTNTVIVDVHQHARVVDFDRAMSLAADGGWIRSYCSKGKS